MHNPWTPLNKVMAKQPEGSLFLNHDGIKQKDPANVAETLNHAFIDKVKKIKKEVPMGEKRTHVPD